MECKGKECQVCDPIGIKTKKTLKYDNHCTLNHRNQQQFHNTPFLKLKEPVIFNHAMGVRGRGLRGRGVRVGGGGWRILDDLP